MIENLRQYAFTKIQLERFQKTLANILEHDQSKLEIQVQRDAVQSEIDVLTEQLAEFDALQRGEIPIELDALERLPVELIKARVAKGYTQAQLAAKLRMKPQKIQRYEATHYASASLSRVLEVARVLRG